MFENLDGHPADTDGDNTFQLVQELERNTPDKLRMHARREIRTGVTVRPANSGDRSRSVVRGSTLEISDSLCQTILPAPCGVGDLFFLEFDRDALDLPKTFARCIRCRLIREDGFEADFSFFTPVSLPAQILA
jgi:hypothetical protein